MINYGEINYIPFPEEEQQPRKRRKTLQSSCSVIDELDLILDELDQPPDILDSRSSVDELLFSILQTPVQEESVDLTERVIMSGELMKPLAKIKGAKRQGRWAAQEDTMLTEAVRQVFPQLPSVLDNNGNRLAFKEMWAAVSHKLPGRSTPQCRYRWNNHLSPNINAAPLTQLEEDLLVKTSQEQSCLIGKWAEMAELLPGRSAAMVRNFFGRQKRQAKRNIIIIKPLVALQYCQKLAL